MISEFGNGDSVTWYYLHVCKPLFWHSECTNVNNQAAICQENTAGGGNVTIIGIWNNSTKWSLVDPSNPNAGVQYQLIGSVNCWYPGYPTNYISTVKFVCSTNVYDGMDYSSFGCS